MLFLSFTPGGINSSADVAARRRRPPTLTAREMGEGIHFVQEDQPDAIGVAISEWLRSLG
jgi:haloalkane dehalogenase